MNLFSFPAFNLSLHIFMNALNCCKVHSVPSKLSPSNNILITNLQVNKHFSPEWRIPQVERCLVGFRLHKGIRRKGKCFHYVGIHAIGGESQFGRKLNPVVPSKRRTFSNVRNLQIRGEKDMQNGDGVRTDTDIGSGKNDLHRTDGTKEKLNDDQEKCLITPELIKNIKENENGDDVGTPSSETEKGNFNFLEHFTTEGENSLVSNLKPEESKELIDSDHFKKMMDDLNIKEEEIMKQLTRSEKNVSSLINKNLSLEQIEKNAKNEEAQNEELFDTYMNSNSSKVGNFINFKKIGKKYKDVISHVIAIFLSKGKKFTEMIKLIEEDKSEINMCISLLEEDVLFNNLSKDVLMEIVKKSVLFGHLNEKFSNDAENFEWSKQIERCIMQSVCNHNFKIKLITYSHNSISVTVVSMKSVHIDSDEHDEYDEIEGSIKNALEEYERVNGLDILSSFNILVHFS
ncbi:Uncharacterized protein PCOAH_00050170 [Plasmodium coatneyi]|uniref:Uncharacterized protein n=1 Tax=Plasmodium coatneyi TaxID=208452 RepID=A0A1B1E7L9_9APIC|nr:Uncharacterized protein PCOAH_00050170 [Plasmodium coatneyi]ANQ10759.1 Uncharacterized protein PCOAH_00050170 [Plasmodium coatneyi]